MRGKKVGVRKAKERKSQREALFSLSRKSPASGSGKEGKVLAGHAMKELTRGVLPHISNTGGRGGGKWELSPKGGKRPDEDAVRHRGKPVFDLRLLELILPKEADKQKGGQEGMPREEREGQNLHFSQTQQPPKTTQRPRNKGGRIFF